eukprot:1176905-Prorocentrum_minimum.AAC.3
MLGHHVNCLAIMLLVSMLLGVLVVSAEELVPSSPTRIDESSMQFNRENATCYNQSSFSQLVSPNTRIKKRNLYPPLQTIGQLIANKARELGGLAVVHSRCRDSLAYLSSLMCSEFLKTDPILIEEDVAHSLFLHTLLFVKTIYGICVVVVYEKCLASGAEPADVPEPISNCTTTVRLDKIGMASTIRHYFATQYYKLPPFILFEKDNLRKRYVSPMHHLHGHLLQASPETGFLNVADVPPQYASRQRVRTQKSSGIKVAFPPHACDPLPDGSINTLVCTAANEFRKLCFRYTCAPCPEESPLMPIRSQFLVSRRRVHSLPWSVYQGEFQTKGGEYTFGLYFSCNKVGYSGRLPYLHCADKT